MIIKAIRILIGITMFYSCSSNNDSNSTNNDSTSTINDPNQNSNLISLPNSPSLLNRISDNDGNKVILNWTDSSDNESGFKIERKVNTGTYQVVQNVTTNVTDFTFSGLSINSTYSYRVCSFNSKGNSAQYSNEVIVSTDIDGNAYTNVKIGNQTWMKENYAVTKYRNGEVIPKMQSGQAVLTPSGYVNWSNLTDYKFGAYMTYFSGSPFPNGHSYNWYAVNDPRGLAPIGWHIPSKADWIVLKEFLGGELIAGGKMKENSSTYWANPNVGATNSSGFTARGNGFFEFNGTALGSTYSKQKFISYFWSSTEFDLTQAYTYKLSNSSERLIESYVTDYKVQGGSVRCIKD